MKPVSKYVVCSTLVLVLTVGSAFGENKYGVVLPGISTTSQSAVAQSSKKKTTTSSSFSTDTVYAFTYNESAETCSDGSARFIGNTSIVVQRDKLNKNTTTAFVSVYEVDNCNFGQEVENATGSFTIDQSQLVIDNAFQTATANGSGEILDQISNQNVPVSFSLSWTGTADLIVINQMLDRKQGKYHEHDTDLRNIRDANVDGTVTGQDDFNHSVFFFPSQVIIHEEGTQVIRQ